MSRDRISVLFVCTHNSARSIMAEAILRRRGQALGIVAYSAGSNPKGAPHPLAMELLRSFGHDVSAVRSKSWTEFEGLKAPTLDYVVAVCDRAAGESCPRWSGRPLTANWAIEDPSSVAGGAVARRVAFVRAYRELEQRIDAFVGEDLGSPQTAGEENRRFIQGRLDLVGEMMYAPSADDLSWPDKLH